METIRITGRASRLSLLQLEKVKQCIEATAPSIKVEIITRTAHGDRLADTPLHTVEGNDFFTRDIFDALENGDADIAVHSLKDMSSEHFFGKNKFAVVDRDDTRDIVLFQKNIEQKIASGKTIVIGTCSPRREEMATGFLQRALPQWNKNFSIQTKSIRGNVDTRLRKLDSGEYDGIILATAGLNRLLSSPEDAEAIRLLLSDKKKMLLPLVECVPAPCQGAIVAEAITSNRRAVAILNQINNPALMNACVQEKQVAKRYGTGCLQRFGVATFSYGNRQAVYASGKDSEGRAFSDWIDLPQLESEDLHLFSSTDFMGNFFQYSFNNTAIEFRESIVYVANYKAIQKKELVDQIRTKQVWASGTKTWYELAQKGIWVEGCADAFGLESLKAAWQMPLYNIDSKTVAIITNEQSVALWKAKGWKAYATYELLENRSPAIEQAISKADIIFWTSYRQYVQYKNVVKKKAVHACPFGETAEQLKLAGLNPVVFPGIKAFQQWRQTSGQ